MTEMPITSVEEKAQRRLEVKARSTLMMGIPNEHQLKFNSTLKVLKKLLEVYKKRLVGMQATKRHQWNLLKQQYENFTTPSSEMFDQTFDWLQKLVSQLELLDEKLSKEDVHQKVKGMSSSSLSTQNMAFVSSSNNNTSNTNEAINIAQGCFSAKHSILNLFLEALTTNNPVDIRRDGFEDGKKPCWTYEGKMVSSKDIREGSLLAPRNQANKNKESSRRSVPMEISTSTALVSCDGLGGYDWSDQAKEGPNYALVAFSSSNLKKSELMVLGYKTGLELVEEKLEVYKANGSIYLQDIKGLKFEIHVGEITIRELRKKLEKVQKEKDGIQLNVDKFKHASKSLNAHRVSDVDIARYDEFVNKPVVENYKAVSSEEEPKVVRKNDDTLIIKEWVSDDEEKDGNPQMDLQNQGVIDSGCSRHMTGNMSYLTEYEEIDGGYVVFGRNPKGGKITRKRTIKTGQARKETEPVKNYILLPLWTADPPYSQDPKSLITQSKWSLTTDQKRGHFDRGCARAHRKSSHQEEGEAQEGGALWKYLLPQLWCHVMVLGVMHWCGSGKGKGLSMHLWYSSSSSNSKVSNDSICSKTCLETIESLKSQNDKLLKDLKKSELMILGYKTGLELVEEKLEVYKANESIYLQDIKGLKFEIHVGEITIRELKKKLEKVQKEKDDIQLNVDKFEHASKSLNKLIECQIVDNCKKGLG
ncbi:hypothetical protein Tco_1124473 [Tanacetum coccineum]|uniref:Retrovirus-related Pol polyprotein from transposon TNT 1-94-like beta-barrel domain-containing protein n=1 Tax=Tanacetum coccineum TaxID=301880 RepID=A0ABQ5J994_9ASTR